MTPLQRLHLRIQEISKDFMYIPVHVIVKEFKQTPDIISEIESLVHMGFIDPAFYKLGEIKLTSEGRLAIIPG